MQSPTADAANVGLFPEVQASRPLAEYNATPYTPEPYDPTKIVADQHHFPRFGHTNDVAALAEGGDAAVDYVVGILSGALLILAVAVMWALLLVGLRVCGQRRVGFLAGRLEHPDLRGDDASRGDGGQLPLIEEEPADGYPLLVSEHSRKGPEATKRAKKFQRTVRANRAAFVLSGVAVIVSSILFLTNGIKSFQGSLVSVNDGLEVSLGGLEPGLVCRGCVTVVLVRRGRDLGHGLGRALGRGLIRQGRGLRVRPRLPWM